LALATAIRGKGGGGEGKIDSKDARSKAADPQHL
jgi:hypothetical protein